MRRPAIPNYLLPAIPALVLLAVACATTTPTPSATPAPAVSVPAALVTPRGDYATSTPFAQLIKPHFFALTEDRRGVAPQGYPELLTLHGGKAKVRLAHANGPRYLDPLALAPERLGEHPVHRLHRLAAMGVPLDDALAARLALANFGHDLFHSALFEHVAGKLTDGVIAEMFPDGTFLVIPSDVPSDWRRDEDGLPPPTHFHVNARALSAPRSELAKQFETEILALPFDDQRYPAPPLARKQCGVYAESVRDAGYRALLDAAGFRFTPAHVAATPSGDGPMPHATPEELRRLARTGAGEGVNYFGFEGYWVADLARELGAPWLKECDLLYAPRAYDDADGTSAYYALMRRSLEPDKARRYRLLRLDDDGSARSVHTFPGIPLMTRPLPHDAGRWLFSAEGWPAPDGDTPPDPRWQSVYLADLDAPDDFQVVEYPLSQFPAPPERGLLYGSAPRLSADGSHMMNVLYGFRDEGGGLWSVSLAGDGFPSDPDAFARVAAWDHLLSWFALSTEGEPPDETMTLFLTGKEVADDFAMTANLLRIEGGGLGWEVRRKERLLQMVGWNPVPFATQTLDGGGYLVAVETHLNYEGSLMPRAKGVYLVAVDAAR